MDVHDKGVSVPCVQAWAAGKLIQMNIFHGADLIYSNSVENFMYGGST